MVTKGQKLAALDVDVKGLDEFAFREAIVNLMKGSVGECADIERDGTVMATSKRRVDFIAGGETLSGQKTLVKEKNLEIGDSFDLFMDQQGGDESGRAREYLNKNNDLESEWLKKRISVLDNGKAESPGIQKSSHSKELIEEHRSLWREKYIDSPEAEGHPFFANR